MPSYIIKGVFAIIVGSVAIISTFVGDNKFYFASIIGVSISKKPMPLWLARLIFSILGVLFILVGMKYLFYGQ